MTEDSPFGPEHLVFKVSGKMFALLAFEEIPPTANLKCDPDLALELRDRYEEVQPGYHMNKKHWNTVRDRWRRFRRQELARMIDHSYDLVVKALPKAARERCERPVAELSRDGVGATGGVRSGGHGGHGRYTRTRHTTQLHFADLQMQRLVRDLEKRIRRIRQRDLQFAGAAVRRVQILAREKLADGAGAVLR